MQSLKYLYRYGMGPSSSHTIGPHYAARRFKAKTKDAKSYRVKLYGSLSLTGKGHLTDKAIINVFAPVSCEIIWCDKELSYHPNGMKFESLDGAGRVISEWTTFSIGGGELRDEGGETSEHPHIYSQKSMEEVLAWCSSSGRPIWQLVDEVEEDGFIDGYLADLWQKMQNLLNYAIKMG